MSKRSVFSFSELLMIIGLFLVVFVTGADSFIISPLLPAIRADFQVSVSAGAVSITIYALCYACGSPFFGPLGDRYNRKTLLEIGISIFLIGSFACALANNISEFYLFRAVAGLGAALTLPNIWATIGSDFTGAKLNTAMGITMSALSLSIAIGVPLGTTLSQISDWHMAFWGSGILTVVAFIVLIIVVPNRRPVKKSQTTYFSSFGSLVSTHNAIPTLMITLVWMFGFYSMYTFLGTFVSEAFKLNTAQTGYVFIAYGLSNFIASFFGGTLTSKIGAMRSVIINGILSSVLVLGLSLFTHTVFVTIVFLIPLALVQGFGVTALTTYIVNVVPNNRSTVMSFNSSFLYLGLTLGSLIGSVVYSVFGFSGVGWIAAIGLLLAVLITWWISVRKGGK